MDNNEHFTPPSFIWILRTESSILYHIGHVKTTIRPSGWHVLLRLKATELSYTIGDVYD